jgi:hypothetical protein
MPSSTTHNLSNVGLPPDEEDEDPRLLSLNHLTMLKDQILGPEVRAQSDNVCLDANPHRLTLHYLTSHHITSQDDLVMDLRSIVSRRACFRRNPLTKH